MTFPLAALEQHVAILGKTGSGKSYTVRGLVENLLIGGARVCIVDYTGVWWGLRLNREGTGPSQFKAVIFGGDHADIPLTEGSGPIVARVVAEGSQPVIIDVDGITVGAQQRFVTAFLEELYKLNRRTLHLVIEEADEFAPQTGAPGAERMIGATCRIFARGRVKGFRAIAVTQRPANIHKKVLTQCNTLVAMRLTAPQDHKALHDWIKGHGDVDKGEEVMKSLARLQRGEGWVWAPELDILERETFRQIHTFDSMRPPVDDENVPEPQPIDLAALKEQFAAAVKEVEANDPKVLKAEIARLNALVSKGGTAADAQQAFERGAHQGYMTGWSQAMVHVGVHTMAARGNVGRALKVLHEADQDLNGITMPPAQPPKLEFDADGHADVIIGPGAGGIPVPTYAGPPVRIDAAVDALGRTMFDRVERRISKKDTADLGKAIKTNTGLDGAAVKLLEAFNRYPTRGLTWDEACIVAGLVPGNGYFYGGKKKLVEGHYVWQQNVADRFVPNHPNGTRDAPITRAEILRTWSKVRAPGHQMLEVVLHHDGISTQKMEQQLGLKAGNGYWYGGLKPLKDANLITTGEGVIRLTEFVREARP